MIKNYNVAQLLKHVNEIYRPSICGVGLWNTVNLSGHLRG